MISKCFRDTAQHKIDDRRAIEQQHYWMHSRGRIHLVSEFLQHLIDEIVIIITLESRTCKISPKES